MEEHTGKSEQDLQKLLSTVGGLLKPAASTKVMSGSGFTAGPAAPMMLTMDYPKLRSGCAGIGLPVYIANNIVGCVQKNINSNNWSSLVYDLVNIFFTIPNCTAQTIALIFWWMKESFIVW